VKVNLESIPIIVRELSDKEVIEIQLVENVQRADVHPLEEADGYRELIDKHGYDVDGIAAKTGKSRSSVFARLKLCDIVGKYAREAFLEDKINASIALIAARIPVPKLQDAFVKKVLDGEAEREAIDGEYVHIKRTLSFREAQLLAQREFMLRLENAPFAIVDDKLVKGVGACVGCLFRTGNQRELFDDVKSADVCTNPPCFEKKKNAQAEREVARGRPRARRCSRRAKPTSCSTSATTASLARVGTRRTRTLTRRRPTTSTARAARGSSSSVRSRGATVLAIDRRARSGSSIHKANAVKALQKLGVLKEKKASSSSIVDSSTTEGADRDRADRGARLEEADRRDRRQGLSRSSRRVTTAAWRWLAEFLVEFSCLGEGYAPMKAFLGIDVDAGDIEKKALAAAKTGEDLRRLAIAAVLADRLGMSSATKDVEKLCKPWGVDMKKVALQAADEVKAELAAAKNKDAAKKTPAKKKAA
jgi:hypothetical protein